MVVEVLKHGRVYVHTGPAGASLVTFADDQ